VPDHRYILRLLEQRAPADIGRVDTQTRKLSSSRPGSYANRDCDMYDQVLVKSGSRWRKMMAMSLADEIFAAVT
jgi:hypothetical protein